MGLLEFELEKVKVNLWGGGAKKTKLQGKWQEEQPSYTDPQFSEAY